MTSTTVVVSSRLQSYWGLLIDVQYACLVICRGDYTLYVDLFSLIWLTTSAVSIYVMFYCLRFINLMVCREET